MSLAHRHSTLTQICDSNWRKYVTGEEYLDKMLREVEEAKADYDDLARFLESLRGAAAAIEWRYTITVWRGWNKPVSYHIKVEKTYEWDEPTRYGETYRDRRTDYVEYTKSFGASAEEKRNLVNLFKEYREKYPHAAVDIDQQIKWWKTCKPNQQRLSMEAI